MAVLAVTAPAQTVTSLAPAGNTTPGVWYESNVTGAGMDLIVDLQGVGGNLETNQPLPTGALRLTTTGDDNDRAHAGVLDDYGMPMNVLSTLSISYSYYKASAAGTNVFAAPSLKLPVYNPVCDDGASSGDCFGTLVYEPSWNQPGMEGSSVAVPLDAWQSVTVDANNGLFWWTGGFGEPNTAGGLPLRTLAQWEAVFSSDFDDASLYLVEIGVGSFNQFQDGYFDDVQITHSYAGGYSAAYDFETASVRNVDTAEEFATIQAAIDDADTLNGHTLEMLVPDHSEGPQVFFDKSLSLRGTGANTLRPNGDTGSSGDARGWFLIDYGVDVTFESLTFDGTGSLVWNAIRNHGTLTIADCAFTNIQYNASGPHYSGIAVSHFDTTGPMTVSDTSFSDIGRIGLHIFGEALVERCVYTGKGVGDWLDYFCCIDSSGASIADATLVDCTATACRGVASTDGSTSGGILITTFFGLGTVANLLDCVLTDNTSGIVVGYDAAEASDVSVSGCSIFGNDFGLLNTSSTVSVDAIGNWWGDASGPLDPMGAMEAGNPPCFPASMTPAMDVVNVDGLGDFVADGNVDYCGWLLVPPPCASVPATEDCTIGPASFEGANQTTYDNMVVVHYNAGVTPGTASIANVAFLEIRASQFATSPLFPDAENYALSVILPAPTSDGSNLPPALLTLDSMTTDFGEPPFGGLPTLWTVDFYSGVNTPGDLAGARFHTVLFGGAADGICDLSQTFLSPEEQLTQTVFKIEDGVYHSINNPEADVTTALLWDGLAFSIPIPGAVPVEPFLFGDSHTIEQGQSTDPTLLTGTADPGFVTLWTTAPCAVETLSSVATNRLGLDIVGNAPCYKAGDVVTVELNMACLVEEVSGFFASVTFDPAVLALQPSSTYSPGPFPLHIGGPIVDIGGGMIELAGTVMAGDPGTTDDALLATLVFEVLAGNDGATTAIAFDIGGSFPTELSDAGSPVPTRPGIPLAFDIDQSAPVLTCPADIQVPNDPGLCSAVVAITPPVPFDACGLIPVVGVRSDALALDDPYPAGCAPGEETLITWTATDCVGLQSVCVQSVRVTDNEDPVLFATPADVMVNADAGGCTALVTWTDPTATDNCDPAPAVVCVPASGFAFPVGTTTVTCTATDACGNFSTSTFDVEVAGVNTVDVIVELDGVFFTPLERCIHFVLDDCTSLDVDMTFSDHDLNGATPVRAVATIEVPCGAYATLCAKDQQHTRWASAALTPIGTGYVAASVLSLVGGDTDDDGDVDINDVTLFITQFSDLALDGGCPWDGTRDSDFSNNGVVGTEDYSFLTAAWLTSSACSCTIASSGPSLTRTFVPETRRRVLDSVSLSADLDGDGWVDHRDVALFEQRHGLPQTLSKRMRR